MASYAPNFTNRLKLSYSTLGANYTQTWRYAESVSLTDFIPMLEPFYDAIAPFLASDFAINAAEFANEGEDFFLPIGLGALATVTGTSVIDPANASEYRASALQFVGKTVIGQPWRVSVYGALTAPFNTAVSSLSDDFRTNAADSAGIASAIVALEDLGTVGLVGNDKQQIFLRPYVNLVVSRYRINRIRKFG